MAKLNELIYSVRESVKEFSDDTELDDRYILHLYNLKRAKYLRQDLNNYQRTADMSIQQEFCMELEEVNSDICGQDIYCEKILRTKQPLPKAIELHTKTAITKIKPSNRLTAPFNVISKERVHVLNHARFNTSVYAFIDNDNHIYLTSKSDTHKLIDCISVSGVFENPLELAEYKTCCGCSDTENTTCFDEDNTEYPLQPHYVDLIKNEIVQDILRSKQIPEDKVNDTND